jgi:hypothetical protein
MKTVADPIVLSGLITRLSSLQPTAVRRWGTLSPAEMLCHLADASGSVLGHPGGPSVPNQPLRKWLALYSFLPWPHGLRTPRSVDPRREGTRPGNFEADRGRAIAGLQALAMAAPNGFPASHRRFGRMTAKDWQHWAHRHTDHHFRQFGV